MGGLSVGVGVMANISSKNSLAVSAVRPVASWVVSRVPISVGWRRGQAVY